MRKWSAPEVLQTFWQPRFSGQIPDDNPVADPLDGPFFELEGRQLVAVNVGHTDTWVWPLDSTTPASAKVAEVATAYFGLHRTALAYCMAMAAFVAVDSR